MTLPRAVLVEALRTYAGHTADCAGQNDTNCTCGWIHVQGELGQESQSQEQYREARYRAAIELCVPFWFLYISVDNSQPAERAE